MDITGAVSTVAGWLQKVAADVAPGEEPDSAPASRDFVGDFSPFFCATDDVLSRTAYHEAGHAVVAYRCGLELLDVHLAHYGPGRTRYRRSDDPAIDLFAEALTALAGPMAEIEAAGATAGRQYSIPRGGDLAMARRLIDRLTLPGDLDARYDAIARVAVATVLNLWPAIDRVAAELFRRRNLTGEDVAALCDLEPQSIKSGNRNDR